MDYSLLRRSCWLEMDLGHVKHNLQMFKQLGGAGVRVMPAVKGNAYSHGIVPTCKALEEAGADMLAVGSLEEGIALREQGIRLPILIFASNTISEVANLYIEHNLIPTILYREQAESLSALARKPLAVFVKIETGRGRLGVNAEECPDFVREIAALPHIHVEGLYSHMSCANWADKELEYSMWQYTRFDGAVKRLAEGGVDVPFRQLANTPGSIAYPDIRMSGLCPGRGIWGESPLEDRPEHPPLKPVLTAWKSRLVQVKEVIGGKLGPNFEPVKLEKPKRIGIMVGGLADGISGRHCRGEVLVRGQRVPVCSAISLEHTTVDLDGCPEARVGDEVVIMGRQGAEEIPVETLLKLWGRSLTEFWVAVPPTLTRVYSEEGHLVCMTSGERLIRL